MKWQNIRGKYFVINLECVVAATSSPSPLPSVLSGLLVPYFIRLCILGPANFPHVWSHISSVAIFTELQVQLFSLCAFYTFILQFLDVNFCIICLIWKQGMAIYISVHSTTLEGRHLSTRHCSDQFCCLLQMNLENL